MRTSNFVSSQAASLSESAAESSLLLREAPFGGDSQNQRMGLSVDREVRKTV